MCQEAGWKSSNAEKAPKGTPLRGAGNSPTTSKNSAPEGGRNQEEGRCPRVGPGKEEMQNLWLRSQGGTCPAGGGTALTAQPILGPVLYGPLQSFSLGTILAPRGHLATSRDIFGCHESWDGGVISI